jgi:Fe-S-cluster-containing dehydrogenase component
VVISNDLCMGCHARATVCPFGEPQVPEGTLMRKCDFCIVRVSSGLEPGCVRACPTRALGFGPIEELAEEKAKAASAKVISSFNPKLVLTLPQVPQK